MLLLEGKSHYYFGNTLNTILFMSISGRFSLLQTSKVLHSTVMFFFVDYLFILNSSLIEQKYTLYKSNFNTPKIHSSHQVSVMRPKGSGMKTPVFSLSISNVYAEVGPSLRNDSNAGKHSTCLYIAACVSMCQISYPTCISHLTLLGTERLEIKHHWWYSSQSIDDACHIVISYGVDN